MRLITNAVVLSTDGPARRTSRLFERLASRWNDYRTRALVRRLDDRSLRELQAFDDRMLADIGLSQSDLPYLTHARRLRADASAWSAIAPRHHRSRW